MANTINLKIDGISVTVDEGTKILDAAKKHNINIPTLCYYEDLCVSGNCRICVVEQKEKKSLVTSCTTVVTEGMEIYTQTPKVRNERKKIIELLLFENSENCTMCYKSSAMNYRNLLMKE